MKGYLEAFKRGKTLLIAFFISYVIFVYIWTKVMLPQALEEPAPDKIKENRVQGTNASDDPVKKYHQARARVLQRTDLPWLRVQENIPHVNIPLFDTLRKNCKTVASKRANQDSLFT